MIKIQNNSAYFTSPSAKTHSTRGVLVLHPWWGLNSFVKEFSDRLAKQGFTALAPDLYNGKIAKTIPEAEQLSSNLSQSESEKKIINALDYLHKLTKSSIGTVGFSMGAYWALWLATKRPNDIAVTVLFYGTGELTGYDKSQSKFLGHFAEKDPYEQEEYIRKLEQNLRSTGKEVSFYFYPGTGHWFFENDRDDAYNNEAANLAWTRTLKFLETELK